MISWLWLIPIVLAALAFGTMFGAAFVVECSDWPTHRGGK